jgi:UPF0755 protein
MGKQLRLALGIAALIIVILGVAFAVQVNIWLQPVPVMTAEKVMVSIPYGASSMAIAEILAEQGLIRNALVFRIYARYRGLDQGLQAGNYLLHYGMTMDEILEELSQGNVYRPTVTVTIPEGYNIEQIARRLEENGLVAYGAFMEAVKKTVPEMGRVVAGQRYALEGYLFPDTYEFAVGVAAQEIIERMLNRLQQVFDDRMQKRAAELGMDIHEVLTLASLVEREARVASERETIASVIHNRLQRNMPLQIDAAVIYALGEHKTVVTFADLEVESPYNLYKYSGLPPGPIASPGEAAIRAVLYPAETDYLYYVVKGDGSGEHYFGRTLQEHEQNKAKARKNMNNRQ